MSGDRGRPIRRSRHGPPKGDRRGRQGSRSQESPRRSVGVPLPSAVLLHRREASSPDLLFEAGPSAQRGAAQRTGQRLGDCKARRSLVGGVNLVTKAHHMMGVAFIVFPLASAPAADAFQSTGDRSAVHDIRKNPDGFQLEERAAGNEKDKNQTVRENALRPHEINHAAFAIVVPAQDRRESKENKTD